MLRCKSRKHRKLWFGNVLNTESVEAAVVLGPRSTAGTESSSKPAGFVGLGLGRLGSTIPSSA